jgi:hypothetical protein
MTDQTTGTEIRCPWCSAVLSDAAADTCPSCGAHLTTLGGAEPSLPGVTTLDADAILRARNEAGRTRSGIISFLTGNSDVPDSGGSAAAIAPPADDVRREMLRLEFAAAQADAVADAVALKSDVLAEQGIHLADLGAIEQQAEAAYESEVEGREVAPPPPDAPPPPAAPEPPAGT